MSNAGRKPIPLALHRINGNPSKKSAEEINATEPPLSERRPNPPAEVIADPAALAEWNRIVPDLHAAGIIKEIDSTALSQYCIAYSEWLIALQSIRKSRIVRSANGNWRVNPAFSIANAMADQMRRMLTEFGMTPSSRVKLRNPQKKSNDPLDDELFG